MSDDKRLIEDYLPIEAISKEASREKSVRKGHISTLHLWWARRPLVACRAAVYGALVPASRFRPKNGPEEKRDSLARANAARFVEALCKYPGDPQVIVEAQRHILEAHAERLTNETGEKVTVEDIQEGRAPRPKVLDMFAGGGAIPLEALRLGCEAYALDLNPVAHIIELCTLVYPQKYGKPDKNSIGSAEDGTWEGLAEEVRCWGNWVFEKVKAEIGDLYPSIPDQKAPKAKQLLGQSQLEMAGEGFERKGQQKFGVDVTAGYLTPVAYLWTRIVTCKNPNCAAAVALLKHTWLCKSKDRFVAMKLMPSRSNKSLAYSVIEATTEKGLGFDPELGSEGGGAVCPFCSTVADADYVQSEGVTKRIGSQLIAVVCTRENGNGKVYLSVDDLPPGLAFDLDDVRRRLADVCTRSGISVPSEPIGAARPSPNARGLSAVTRHGFTQFGELFAPRQQLALLTFAAQVCDAEYEMRKLGYGDGAVRAVMTYLGATLDRLADFNSSFCIHNYLRSSGIAHTFGRHALGMVWDFAEANPFNEGSGGWGIDAIHAALSLTDVNAPRIGSVQRGSATNCPWPDAVFDAVITDPPYYDNVPYADISDFFYVWLKRTVGHLYPDHFATELTPKKAEATALASRHAGDMRMATAEYENLMSQSLREAARVLKPEGELVVVYAHKTTLGWATLVDALRRSGFMVTEAWPLDTEKPGRLVSQDASALASSIFLVAQKRSRQSKGTYEHVVQGELQDIVRERVTALWDIGISGADLVISCVGAGLRAFTRYAEVEYSNGEEVAAERFLREVETAVLEAILGRLSKEVGGNGGRYGLAGVDAATRFYTLWRYTYKSSELDSGEAIIFANGTHVELDGLHGLSSGSRPLVEKKKAKYRLLDYANRGDDAKLGLPSEDGNPAPLVDALHRVLWLMERHPTGIPQFLRDARPNTEQMRLVAQALAGPALKGGELSEVATGSELAALTKLTANWRSVVEDAAGPAEGPLFRGARGRE